MSTLGLEAEHPRALATLPLRLGGLGLTSLVTLATTGWLGSIALVWPQVRAITGVDWDLSAAIDQTVGQPTFVQDTSAAAR